MDLLLTLALFFLVFASPSQGFRGSIENDLYREPDSAVVELNDLNFDSLVDGKSTWMLEIYAPWCATCRELEQPWEELARRLYPHIRVGKIDATLNPTLVRRFGVRHLPTIYHIRRDETRELLTLTSSVPRLVAFAEGGWREVEPRALCGSPTSRCGRAVGAVVLLPQRARETLRHLHDDLHFSPVTLLAGSLLIPVVAGLALVGAMDVYCSHVSSPAERNGGFVRAR